jgi:hypothetical protein
VTRPRIHSRHGADRSRPSDLLLSPGIINTHCATTEGNGQLPCYQRMAIISSAATRDVQRAAIAKLSSPLGATPTCVSENWKRINSPVQLCYGRLPVYPFETRKQPDGGTPYTNFSKLHPSHYSTILSSLGHRGGLFPLSRARAATHYPQAPFGWD